MLVEDNCNCLFVSLGTIRIMGFWDKLRWKKERSMAPVPAPNDDTNRIQVFDEFGRELFVTREQWRSNILPGALKANQGTPHSLTQIVARALQDGFAADVLDAARDLHHQDPASSLTTCIYGIALMQTQRNEEAEHVLSSFLQQHGDDAAVLTNLAKVHASHADEDRVDPTLWRALQTDPNFDNGFTWYVARSRERDGQKAEPETLKRIAAIPGSWRAQLWLARKALDARETQQALAYYQEALDRAGDSIPADFLMQMSGDLGQHGLLDESLRLTEPRFSAEAHGLPVGNNLIKANLDLGRIEQAAKILRALQALPRPEWKAQLSFWDTELAKARLASAPESGKAPNRINMLVIDGPVWLNAASPARDLFEPKAKDSPIVCVLGSTAETGEASDEFRLQLANPPGRLSRAIPLFLSEQIEAMTGARTKTLFPWAEGEKSFVLSGHAWTDEVAAKYAAHASDKCEFVVVCHLKAQAEPWQVQIRVIRVADATRVDELTAAFPMSTPEEAIPALGDSVISTLSKTNVSAVQASPFYQVPAGVNFGHYLVRLEQLLSVRCAAMEGVSSGTFLSGEREILDSNLGLNLACPENVIARVLLLQTMLTMKQVRSEVVAEFQERVMLLQDRHPLAEPAERIARQMLAELAAASE